MFASTHRATTLTGAAFQIASVLAAADEIHYGESEVNRRSEVDRVNRVLYSVLHFLVGSGAKLPPGVQQYLAAPYMDPHAGNR